MAFRSGFVALIGRPNVGKSTLLNRLVGERIAITSPVMQTTRHRIRGILTEPDVGQVVLLDTPGLSKPIDHLGHYLVDETKAALGEADAFMMVVDATEEPGPGDMWIAQQVLNTQRPICLVLNKMDRLAQNGPLREARKKAYLDLFAGTSVQCISISAKTGRNTKRIIHKLLPILPEGPAYYEEDALTDQRMREMSAEMIREQVLHQLRDELPHAVAVVIDHFDESSKVVRIVATLFVDQPSQKGIVIGKQGQMIRTIGEGSRKRIEAMLERKVFLELLVKVRKNWRKDERFLKNIGLASAEA